jgi:hypothetical protein
MITSRMFNGIAYSNSTVNIVLKVVSSFPIFLEKIWYLCVEKTDILIKRYCNVMPKKQNSIAKEEMHC